MAGHRVLKAMLLFGANASGKTNVLNALNVLRKLATVPAASKTEGTPCVPFLMDRESRLQPTEFEIDFIQGKDVFRYTVKADRDCVLYERLRSQSRRRIVFTRNTDVKSQLTKIVFGDDYPVKNDIEAATLSSNTLWNETVLAGYTKTNMDHKALLSAHNWFQNYLSPIVNPRHTLTRYVLDLMDKGLIDKDKFTEIKKHAPLTEYSKTKKYYQQANDIYKRLNPYLATAKANAAKTGSLNPDILEKGLSEMQKIFEEFGI